MEGVRLFTLEELGVDTVEEAKILVEKDLQQVLSNLALHIFGDVEMKWSPDSFPFTHPSLELEIVYNGELLEILGCGVILDGVMKNGGLDTDKEVGWAFGLGLERWAMKLFGIEDIRLFWSQDERFLSQFEAGKITKFKPYSKYPVCYKDIAFWLPNDPDVKPFNEIEFHQLVRDVAGDLAENVEVID
jgi:phenylalanyl-tRNA synthetase alpha chain